MTIPTLFDVPAPEPLRKPKGAASKGGNTPKWASYRPKNPIRCDHCALILVETRGKGPVARHARYRRKVDGSDLLLCYEHAQLQRDADGLPGYRR